VKGGMGLDSSGYLGDGRATRPAIKRRIKEGAVPAWREEGIGLEVACLRRYEERLSRGNDGAQAKVRV
jgi:hypothetical protein